MMPVLELEGRPATAAEMNAVMVRFWNTLHPEAPIWDIDESGSLTWEEVYRDYQGAD